MFEMSSHCLNELSQSPQLCPECLGLQVHLVLQPSNDHTEMLVVILLLPLAILLQLLIILLFLLAIMVSWSLLRTLMAFPISVTFSLRRTSF